MNLVISVSREYGSGGREIAEKVAKRLGIGYYDKVLIKRLTEQSGLPRETVEALDEKPFSKLLLNPNRFLSGAEDDSLISTVRGAEIGLVRTIAETESCVFVGRGIDSILSEHAGLIRLFVCAPLEDRIARVMRRNDLDEREARARIARIDKERATYYRYFTDQKWGYANNYDLCINSGLTGIEGAVETVLQFVEHARR